MRDGHLAPACALALFALVVFAAGGIAAADWVSYLDPSLISEIILHNGELYLATSGGLVVYNPSTGDVDQFTNTIGLPSTFLTCLTVDSNGDIYAGTEDAGIARPTVHVRWFQRDDADQYVSRPGRRSHYISRGMGRYRYLRYAGRCRFDRAGLRKHAFPRRRRAAE